MNKEMETMLRGITKYDIAYVVENELVDAFQSYNEHDFYCKHKVVMNNEGELVLISSENDFTEDDLKDAVEILDIEKEMLLYDENIMTFRDVYKLNKGCLNYLKGYVENDLQFIDFCENYTEEELEDIGFLGAFEDYIAESDSDYILDDYFQNLFYAEFYDKQQRVLNRYWDRECCDNIENLIDENINLILDK